MKSKMRVVSLLVVAIMLLNPGATKFSTALAAPSNEAVATEIANRAVQVVCQMRAIQLEVKDLYDRVTEIDENLANLTAPTLDSSVDDTDTTTEGSQVD